MTDAATEAFQTIDARKFFDERACSAVPYRKDVVIKARPAVEGEVIVTRTDGGHVETTNTAGANDVLIRNPGGEEYLIGAAKFAQRYAVEGDGAPDAEGFVTHRAVGGPVSCLRLSLRENVAFTAPWGETMRIQGGGVLVDGGGADVYGIQRTEFRQTYRPCLLDGTFIPADLWEECYRIACDDARETAWHSRGSGPTQAQVEFTTWQIAEGRMQAQAVA